MDDLTRRYYATRSDEIADEYESDHTQREVLLRRGFIQGMRILDVGAGAGRDVCILRDIGCDAYGVEPCDELRLVAAKRHPELMDRLIHGSLPDLGKPFGGDFDGVICSSVLMHLPKAQILDAAI